MSFGNRHRPVGERGTTARRGTLGMILIAILALGGCEMADVLSPSDEDLRETAVSGTVGHLPGQVAADFAVPDSLGDTVRLSDQLAGGTAPADAVVLYFTMWCPICLSHSDHLLNEVVPRFSGRGTVRYYLVDYVSGSVTTTRSMEIANGYAGSALTTLADTDQTVYNQFDAGMGTVVVIDPQGTIHVNEDYRDGVILDEALDSIL